MAEICNRPHPGNPEACVMGTTYVRRRLISESRIRKKIGKSPGESLLSHDFGGDFFFGIDKENGPDLVPADWNAAASLP